jgi:hypothetical protein
MMVEELDFGDVGEEDVDAPEYMSKSELVWCPDCEWEGRAHQLKHDSITGDDHCPMCMGADIVWEEV